MFIKYLKLTWIEITTIVFLFVVSGLMAVGFNEYILTEKDSIRFAPAIISFLPVLFFYLCTRFFLRLPSALAITFLLLYLLAEINNVKQALTSEPLGWSDLFFTSNISVVQHYVSIWHLVMLSLFFCLILLIFKFKQFRIPSILNFFILSMFVCLLFPVTFHPYIGKIGGDFGYKLQMKVLDWGVRYYSWDWAHNLKSSGLPLHLIQTSQREIPAKPNNAETAYFASLHAVNTQIESRPKNVIFILCEACWFKDELFLKEFKPLEERSFKNFRAISPTYGGGTVNSSFELLTGLPAHGALTGVIYQEYGTLMRDEVLAFPRAIKSLGYRTIAAHNHYRKFWRRNLIKPKLGFDRFYGLEDMNYSGPVWADDKVLFSKILLDIKENKVPTFYFLTTVYNHGGYVFDGDYGEGDYAQRLEKTILRISDFIDEVLKIEPDTAILIIGDHKPALTKFFYEKSIFPDSLFSKIGDLNEEFRFKPNPPRHLVGDVPAFFYHPDKSRQNEFLKNGNLKSFYCLSNLFDQIYLGVDLPAFSFVRQNNLCTKFSASDYYENAKAIPDYIYSLSLIR